MADIKIPLPKRFQKSLIVNEQDQGKKLFEYLANTITPSLSKAIWKKCITAGSVWITSNKKRTRVKRVTLELKTGDKIEVFFDPKVLETKITNRNLEQSANSPILVSSIQNNHYDLSIWYKPINMISQDSPYGDQSSLYSYVSRFFKKNLDFNRKTTNLIHRLDRETDGLILFAHDAKTTAKLNLAFSNKTIQKTYYGLIIGNEKVVETTCNDPIDGKESLTHVSPVSNQELEKLYLLYPETKVLPATWCKLMPVTGRKHQLRIHLQKMGRPLLHDPRYSRTHKKGTRLYLCAYQIVFDSINLNLLDEKNFILLKQAFANQN